MQQVLNSPWDELTLPVIMVVEDSDEDFYTFLRAAQKLDFLTQLPYPFLRFEDGDEALDYLLRQGEYETLEAPLPALVLLDLNLPGTDGRDIIRQVKQSAEQSIVPIVVLTTSNNSKDIDSCYRYGANSYLLKPMGMAKMQKTVQDLFQYWFNAVVLPSQVEHLAG